MAARKTPPPKRDPSPNKAAPRNKPKDKPGGAYTYSDTSTPISGYKTPFKNDLANQGKAYLIQSYGKYAADGTVRAGNDASMSAVMDYYKSLPRKQRAQAYAGLAKAVNDRDFSTWSNPFYSVLKGDLSMDARIASAAAAGPRGTATYGEMPAPGDGGLFQTGVSGATGEFIREAGGQGPAGEAAETSTTKTRTKKGKGKTQKLVKRTTKKTTVKGKTVRKALRSPGITKSDKKTYARVAKQAPKLSSRLRVADRAAAKKGK